MFDPASLWSEFKKNYSLAGLSAYAVRFRKRPKRVCQDPGEPWEKIRYGTLDGWNVTAFHAKAGEKVAILVHGLHGDLSRMIALAGIFQKHGFSVILPPVRGHDGHPCLKTSGGPEEALDIIAAVQAAEDMGYPARNIILYGSSMGAAVAVKVGSLLAPRPIAGVMAQACYTSFFDAAHQKLGAFRTGMLKSLIPGEARRSLEDFKPADYVKTTPDSMPFVFINGTRDSVCPPEMGSILADSASRGLFMALGGAGHPRWELPELQNSWQLEKAIQLALDWMAGDGRAEGTLFIDEECNSRNVSRFRKSNSITRNAR